MQKSDLKTIPTLKQKPSGISIISSSQKPKNHNIQKPETMFCLWCWQNRVVTTNGKCFVCGALLVSQKHWQGIIEKMRLIDKHREGVNVEIKKKMYIIPYHYFEEMKDLKSPKEEAMFIEKIKTDCKSYSIKD